MYKKFNLQLIMPRDFRSIVPHTEKGYNKVLMVTQNKISRYIDSDNTVYASLKGCVMTPVRYGLFVKVGDDKVSLFSIDPKYMYKQSLGVFREWCRVIDRYPGVLMYWTNKYTLKNDILLAIKKENTK